MLEFGFNYRERGLKRQGYFVDLAAGHPTRFSNTYFLETHLQWSGLLIEPNPIFVEQTQRLAKVIDPIVADGKNHKFRTDNAELGGLVGDNFDNNVNVRGRELRQAELIDVTSVTLTSLLRENSAPNNMDYLSLDVEGSELLVMQNLDFEQFRFRCMTVERPPLQLDLLLDYNGYIQVNHHNYDTFYAHKSWMDQVRLSGSPRYLTTPRKDW